MIFLSTLSLRRATSAITAAFIMCPLFLSTLSLRRATRCNGQRAGRKSISIHALLAESDSVLLNTRSSTFRFLSTLSLRRATQAQSLKIPPLRISIHALLAESDWARGSRITYVEISIHALLAESDTPITFRHCTTYLFLSTLSLRRATSGTSRNLMDTLYFYPRSPCGERLSALAPKQNPTQHFYPRSPCGERHTKFWMI